MRWMSAACGLVLIVVGAVATITGEFDADAGWLLAFGFGVVGLVGLASAIAPARPPKEPT